MRPSFTNESELTARFNEFETIDWLEEAEKQKSHKKVRSFADNNSVYSILHSTFNLVQVWIVIFLVGTIIGLNTAVISSATEWLSDIKLGYCSKHWWLNEKFCCWQNWDTYGSCDDWKEWSVAAISYRIYPFDWIVYVFFGLALATTCAFLVQQYAPYAAGSGLPEIKTVLAGYFFDKFMNGWTLIIKSIGLAIAVSSGLSVGKEGPAVHMGVCVGNVVSQYFSKYKNNKIKLREILSASAAAGIAVAFGSPIGGVLFSLEDISYVFPLKTLSRSFFCALIATTVLHVINPFRTGKIVMFQAKYTRQWHLFEILFFIILGVFGGLCGAYLTKINIKVARFRKKYLSYHPIQEVAVLALGSTVIFYTNIFTRTDMGKLLSYLFQECEDGNWANLCTSRNSSSMIYSLLFATITRFIGTALAYGCKIPCGIFVPSMAIGATFGRMLGNIVQILHGKYPESFLFAQCPPDTQCVTSATYAFLGAAAALTGITRVTVAVVVIMYELTGAVNFIVPTMIVVMVAKVVADYISPGAISEQMILLNGLPFIELESSPLGMQVSEIMTTSPVVLSASGMTIDEMYDFLNANSFKAFPIVSNQGEMMLEGLVSRKKIRQLLLSMKQRHSRSLANNLSESFSYPDSVSETLGTANTLRISQTGTNNNAFNQTGLSHLGQPVRISFLKKSIVPNGVDFSSAVDYTPIVLDINTSTETVEEIFTRLGPRIILVQDIKGCLVGLVTRKDFIKAKLRNSSH